MQIRRRKPSKIGIRQAPQIRCPAHLQWVRGHECAASNNECLGRIEAAHVRSETDGGLGLKPSDIFVIPLCNYHNREQHNKGEKQFEMRHGFDMKSIAKRFADVSPHRFKWEKEEAA